ncbi:MAG: hypothetical protein LC808_11970 [Actinobacteria bacterium]|nr:hypothetical protein [Actinomycetota bacterium]
MSLDTWEVADRLYLVRGDEVSQHRPLFTGDVLDDVPIPGVQDSGPGIVVAHPCSMRGRDAQLLERILVAAVAPHDPVPASRWADGYLDRMPLPELRGPGAPFEVGWLDRVGRATRDRLLAATRLACLSTIGVNMLQQRLVCTFTRVEIPTALFWDAFGHTFEEADLLEEWTDTLAAVGVAPTDAAAAFEAWIRAESRQERVKDPQQRAPVRAEMRAELRRRQDQ